MPRMVHNSAVELASPLFRRKRKRSNTGSRSSAGLKSFSIVGRRYPAGSSRRLSPFISDRFERRGLVYVGSNINNPAQTQATNGSGYWQSHGSEDWEPTLSVANGQPVSQTDALNNTTSYTYNSLGKVLTVTDAEYNVTSYTYNLLGQMTSLTDPEGNATAWTYDSMGRVVTETNEKNAIRAYEYDDLGRLIQTTDRNGRVIQYEYDYLGRQTAEKWLDSNNVVIGSILYTYDGNNNLLTVTDSISGTDYEYRYDTLNRCVYTKVDSDELNSPVEFTYAYNSSDLTVTETLTGLINGIVAPYYQNVYQYDVFGRLESISQTGTGLTAKSVDYVYNLNGQRVSAEYQQNGDTVSESNWVYDVAGKVSSIQHKTASDAVFAEYGFTWDAGNRIIEIDSTDGTAEYTCDKTGQLIGADYDYITDELYTYDDNGNRTNAGYVTGENNETLSDGTYRYSYDAEGNRVEKFLWTDTNNDGIIDASEKTLVQTYNWDYRNRLESVTNYENGIAKEVMDYLYDYLNLMIERTVTDAATSILQSSEYNLYSNGQVVLEYDTTSSVDVVKSINLWGANIDELAAVEQFAQSVNDSNVILWTYGDHLNSIRDIAQYNTTTEELEIINHLIYNAFGVLVSSTDGAAVPVSISPLLNYRYTGKFFDDSTGLQNNINRWYDNTTGKWLSVDPIGFYGGTPNLYQYVGNQPICDWDQLGLAEYREKFIDKLKEKIGDNVDIDFSKWEVHHIIPQRLKDIGGIGNLDSLDNLVLIPKEVHYQITAIQNSEFVDWTNKKDTILKKLSNNNEKQLKIDKEINKIIYENYLPIMNDNIEDVFGKYMIRIDDDVKTIIAKIDNVNKANKNIKEFKAMLEHKRFIALQQIQKYFPRMLIGLSVFVTYEQAKEIANPSPQTEKALENLISVYRGALYENCKYHHVRSDTWGKIGTYLDQYLAAIQADAKLRMFLQYEILKKENGM